MRKYNDDDFVELRKSDKLPYCDNIFIALESSEKNELKLEIVSNCDLNDHSMLGLTQKHFVNYFRTLLLDIFVYSRYLPINEAQQLVDIEEHSRKLIFLVRSSQKLTTNQDIE
jgi:hypothetical protein